jgi:cytoskeletal protein CcmA (bactofilin family)
LTLLLLALAAPVLAAPVAQSGGDVHFGAYTLEVGQKATGDLVVFGGPVTMRVGSFLAGDLTVFGTVEMEREATLDGQLVVFGSADVSGAIEGDVFAVDGLALRSTAVVAGDVVVAGTLNQHPDAVVRGTVRPMRQGDWQWPGGIVLPRPLPDSGSTGDSGISTPRWVTFLWRVTRGIASVVIMALLALVIVSLWPTHLERVSRTIEEAPLLSFGVGLLALILSGLAAALLAITICLSPLALVGIIAVGVGLLMGWVALGLALGRRVFAGLAGRAPATIAVAALVGTTLVTALMAVSRVFGGLNALLVFLLVPPAAGAVLLTRFGSRPYATRGVVPTPSPTPRPVSAPLPRDTREAQLGADLNADVEVSGNPTITE